MWFASLWLLLLVVLVVVVVVVIVVAVVVIVLVSSQIYGRAVEPCIFVFVVYHMWS